MEYLKKIVTPNRSQDQHKQWWDVEALQKALSTNVKNLLEYVI
jgi:hypothetical protein